ARYSPAPVAFPPEPPSPEGPTVRLNGKGVKWRLPAPPAPPAPPEATLSLKVSLVSTTLPLLMYRPPPSAVPPAPPGPPARWLVVPASPAPPAPPWAWLPATVVLLRTRVAVFPPRK